MNDPAIFPIGKFFRLPRQDRFLLLEATLWIAVAGFAIAVLPFRHLGLLAARPIRQAKPAHQLRAIMVGRIRWAIITVTRRVPWRASPSPGCTAASIAELAGRPRLRYVAVRTKTREARRRAAGLRPPNGVSRNLTQPATR